MSQIFLKELGIKNKIDFLNIGSGSHGKQTAEAINGLEYFFKKKKPSIVLVQGDTNTVLAGGIAAVKLKISVGHVEAGLRSYDLRMPEEYNRRLVDHLSDFLYAPTKLNKQILEGEKVLGKIFVTGNTVIDACKMFLPIAEKNSKIMTKLGLKKMEYALATIHRAENVDEINTLKSFANIFSKCQIPVILPLHPRTRKLAKNYKLKDVLFRNPNIKVIEPVGYFDFLLLMKNSTFIFTDSGGIQEEATAPNIRKKVFVLRKSTERPEAVKTGYCEVVGVDLKNTMNAVKKFLTNKPKLNRPSPYGKGDSASQIVNILDNEKL
jgi:UDP-N-acetylglucosamine 2-epimerase (non-hydrolysing)